MRAVGTGKRAGDRALKRLRTPVTKRRDDAYRLRVAYVTEILAGPEVFPANRARRRIQQRYRCLQYLTLAKRDHVSTRAALASMLLRPGTAVQSQQEGFCPATEKHQPADAPAS